MTSITTSLGDGNRIELSPDELRSDIVQGSEAAAKKGKIDPLSPEEIDHMVDIACGVEGVAGAQIAGAGLGGCIMILARREAVERLRRALVREYYRPRGLKPAVLPCLTVEGAGLAAF